MRKSELCIAAILLLNIAPPAGASGFESFQAVHLDNAEINAKSISDLQDKNRKKLAKVLGISELLSAPRCDLQPRRLWKRDYPFGSIEKVQLQMEPGVRGLIYVCLPKNAKPPYKAFICLQGHSTGMHTSIGIKWQDEKTVMPYEDRFIARRCLQNGITAVCMEQRYMGEFSTRKDREPTCGLGNFNAIMRGRSAIGERVFDVDRVIDYLSTRKDFDTSQIGIMGNSGGGTSSMFSGAMLKRITHVLPSCAVSDFKGSIGSFNHCSCNCIPNLYNYGNSGDVLSLIAPRPLVVLNGLKDREFPVQGAEKQMARVKEVYKKMGAEKNVYHVLTPAGHKFFADPVWKHMLPLWQNYKTE